MSTQRGAALRGHMQQRRLDLNDDRVVFRRVHGRVIPVRVSAGTRIMQGLKGSLAPAAVAAVLGEGLAVATKSIKAGSPLFSLKNASHFGNLSTLKTMGKVAALTVGFSIGYNLLFGKRQRHVVQLDHQPRDPGKARIWLGSKPGFLPGHQLGEHSYLHVRDKRGRVTTFGGQIKNLAKYGKSGVKLVTNFPTDKISLAHNIHDLTPHTKQEANVAVGRIKREAARLKATLQAKDYQYRSIPIKKNKYNSNSVTGTLIRRSGLEFRYNRKHHNMPGFNRTIPKG